MGVFQASMLEAMKSLREKMQSMKKASTSTSKAGHSKQPHPIIHPNPWTSDHSDGQPMETDFCGPSLPPRFTQSVNSDHGSRHSYLQSEHTDPKSEHSEQPQRVCFSRAKKHSDKKKHKEKRMISPLFLLKNMLSLNRVLLSKTKNRITQTQSFTGM